MMTESYPDTPNWHDIEEEPLPAQPTIAGSVTGRITGHRPEAQGLTNKSDYVLTPDADLTHDTSNSTSEHYSILLRDYTTEREENSNIMRHAKRELELWGGPGYSPEMDADFCSRILDVMRIFTSMGHSGLSASIFTGVTKALMDWENLTPLTDNPAEWVSLGARHFDGQVMYQSSRRPEAFSTDGGKTYRLQDEGKWVDARTWKTPFLRLYQTFWKADVDTTERKHIDGPLHETTKVDPGTHGEYL